MSTTSASIRYRPLRIGFLVRDGVIDDLVCAAGLNTLLWGGIYNPMIPLSPWKPPNSAEQLLDLFSVDVLVPVSQSEAISAFMKKHKFLQPQNIYAEEEQIFYSRLHGRKKLIRFLDSLAVVNHYREKKLTGADGAMQSNYVLPRWDPADALNTVFALQYGFFPKEYDLENDFEDAFLNGLPSEEVTIVKDAAPPAKIAENPHPISLTRELLMRPWDRHPDGIFFGDENSFEDLTTFWNVRASGSVLLFFPRDHMQRFEEIAETHLKRLDEITQRNSSLLMLYHRTATREEVAALRGKFPISNQLEESRCTDAIWNGLNIRPAAFCFRPEEALASVERSPKGFTVYVQLPEMKFLADIDRESCDFQLAVEVLPHGESMYSGHSLRVPRIRQLNEFYGREIRFDPWAVRVQNDCIASIIETKTKLLPLYPIANLVLIRRIFEFAGMKADISQPGRLATKIIEKLGGIESARVFKIRGVRELMQKLKPDQSVTHGDAMNKIWAEEQFKDHEDLYIEPREWGTKLTKNNVFDFLLKHEFFRGGLELECGDCKLDNWLSLGLIDEAWTCEYCGSRNLTSLYLRNRGDWKFRKSGLFAKDNNQEGSIPVLLALLVFSRILGTLSEFAWTTALKLQEPDCEIDFCVLKRLRDRVEIGIGECKTGGPIDHRDLDNLKKVRENLVDAGLDCYITLAKTTNDFTEEETELFSRVAGEGIPLILLTKQEMEQTYHPYWDDASGALNKYPITLADIASNSKKRYLSRK